MITGLDSSFARPTLATIARARAAGVGLWSGYLATKPNVGLASPWDQASFDVARQVGSMPIAFCSGWDDPLACKHLAAAWNVRLCIDVEAGIRDDGPWVQGWLDISGAGLYGQHYQDTNSNWHSIHLDRKAAFHVMSWYIGRDPGASWAGPRPTDGSPLGWQWQGGHTEFGLDVDRGTYDDWFAGSTLKETNMLMLHPPSGLGVLISGDLVVQLPPDGTTEALQGAGVQVVNVTQAFFDNVMSAAAIVQGSVKGSLNVSGLLNVARGVGA